jgi:hypothetical protein
LILRFVHWRQLSYRISQLYLQTHQIEKKGSKIQHCCGERWRKQNKNERGSSGPGIVRYIDGNRIRVRVTTRNDAAYTYMYMCACVEAYHVY